MYLGKIVERGLTEEVLSDPKHPYTQALLSALPSLGIDDVGSAIELDGELPSPTSLPTGCAFHPRCHLRLGYCDDKTPEQTTLGESRTVACHLYSDQTDPTAGNRTTG